MKSINNAASAEMPWKPALEEENAQHHSVMQPVEKVKSKLYIKNMVSASCKMVVETVLELLEFRFTKIELGEVEILDEPDEKKLEQLKTHLRQLGFDLITNRRNVLVEKIRNAIVEMVFSSEEMPRTKFSDYLSKKLNLDYSYLSHLFSEERGTTIEHCIMSHKIEMVKEMLLSDELTLSEIAYKLNYSSVAHLSNQFKKITGFTPSHFKKMEQKRFIAFENL
jgi:AraC-like DNA-binding protein